MLVRGIGSPSRLATLGDFCGFADGKPGGTTDGNPASPEAVGKPRFSLLELALMPAWRRELRLRHMGADAPTADEIDAAWREMHTVTKGRLVYFIVRGATENAPIKIGLARDPRKRMAALQTACAERLVLLASCPGDRGLEQEYHLRFAEHRLEGEWFKPAHEIMEEIGRIWENARALRHLASPFNPAKGIGIGTQTAVAA